MVFIRVMLARSMLMICCFQGIYVSILQVGNGSVESCLRVRNKCSVIITRVVHILLFYHDGKFYVVYSFELLLSFSVLYIKFKSS